MPLCLILIEDEDSNSGRQARTSVRLPLQPERVLTRHSLGGLCGWVWGAQLKMLLPSSSKECTSNYLEESNFLKFDRIYIKMHQH
jgi:hypothetical protein